MVDNSLIKKMHAQLASGDKFVVGSLQDLLNKELLKLLYTNRRGLSFNLIPSLISGCGNVALTTMLTNYDLSKQVELIRKRLINLETAGKVTSRLTKIDSSVQTIWALSKI